MEDINIKSIRYPVAVDEKLEKLASKLRRTKRLCFIQMIDYFYKNGKDPADLNDEVLKKEIASGITRIISFIRRQESDFLLPVFTDIGKLITIANSRTKFLIGIGEYVIRDEEQSKQFLMRLSLLDQAIAKTQSYQDEKVILKTRFKKILDYYITQRESLGWPVSMAKKEELQSHVRRSLENL